MTLRRMRLAGALMAGIVLVGVSASTHAQAADEAPAPGGPGSPVVEAETVLRPGPGPLVVAAIGADTAELAWGSVWDGATTVFYGETPGMTDAVVAGATAAKALRLAGLKPGTRYFVRVETRTSQGVARSAVCSFRTR